MTTQKHELANGSVNFHGKHPGQSSKGPALPLDGFYPARSANTAPLLWQSFSPPRTEWLVPTIVQLELSKWLTRELGEDKADQVIAFTGTCVVAGLDMTLALSAAELSARRKLATADAIVYATALAFGADLLTCDRHFAGLPRVRLLAKTGN
jgi:predicted nucleic acid-binding protein